MTPPDPHRRLVKLGGAVLKLVYPRGRVRTVLAGPLRGAKFVVRHEMGVAYALGLDGQSLRFLADRAPAGGVAYDLGGNRGQVALLLARAVGPGGRVVSLEPVPEVADDLERNLALNGAAHARVVRAAASDAAGTATFEFSPRAATRGKLRAVEPTLLPGENAAGAGAAAAAFEVPTVTLDDLVAEGEPPPDLIKIDVEGGAAAALRGAREVLRRYGPAVFIELHGPEERAGVRDELLDRGYRAETLSGEPVSQVDGIRANPLWCVRDGWNRGGPA